MQKIMFIIISLLIFGFIIYMGISALIRGNKSKKEKKDKEDFS
tara:strand:- start:1042 stop:1170 length:129 start_codon:yes stop_codon:yes gene_type:complete